MKQRFKKIVDLFNSYYMCFISIDTNCVSTLVYKVTGNDKQIVASCNTQINTINEQQELLLKETSYAIAKNLDEVEQKIKQRITKVTISVVSLKSKVMFYKTDISVNQDFSWNNLSNYIDINAMNYILGEEYFLTNFVLYDYVEHPAELNNNKSFSLTFIMAGYNREFITGLNNICNNLSLELENVVFTPLVLPFISNYNIEEHSLLYILNDFSLLYAKNEIKILSFGGSYLTNEITNMTSIPNDVIIYNLEFINRMFYDCLKYDTNNSFIKIQDYNLNNIEKIIKEATNNYVDALSNLIKTSNLLIKNQLIIIDNDLDYFNKQEQLSIGLNNENVQLKKIIIEDNPYMQNLQNSDILNMGLAKYYYLKANKDLGVLSFKNRFQNMLNKL
ncbi:hypothetical protein ACFX5K_02595 [Rickettsiales bacterium LUAb2]